MSDSAAGKRVALLVEDDFEDVTVSGPLELLRAAGVAVTLVGHAKDATYTGRRGLVMAAELGAGQARVKDFDAVVIPGGYAPDRMRLRHAMVDLVRDMLEAGKPVAAIDHGPSLVISALGIRGRTLTCWPSIALDIKNAGGLYVDKPVAEDGPVITSRKTDDVPPFCDAILRALARASA